MPAWPPIIVGTKHHDLSHLHPFTLDVMLDGRPVLLHVDFGPHVFSNEKGNGPRIPFLREERYFCTIRYETSFDTACFMRSGFVDGHARTFLNRRQKQQFYTLDAGSVVIFVTLQKAADEEDAVKCRVVSAYAPTWSRNGLPRGKLYAVRTVLRRRLNGQHVPVR